MRLSKSKIIEFNNCPRKFYIKNFSTVGKCFKQSEKPDYITKGLELHDFFESYNDGHDQIDNFIKYFEKYPEFKEQIDNFFDILEHYKIDKAEFAELKIYDEELDLVGIIDAIYEVDGEYWIVDYKTGKRKSSVKDMMKELLLYAIIVERNIGIEISKVGMFFTKYSIEENKTFVKKITPEQKVEALEEYLREREQILNCNFERKPSRLCDYCEYNGSICDDFRDEIIVN